VTEISLKFLLISRYPLSTPFSFYYECLLKKSGYLSLDFLLSLDFVDFNSMVEINRFLVSLDFL
jgi:hypothetical protein